jgi:FtsP/CotA-like multicopper oxidase with cupredoxin domain
MSISRRGFLAVAGAAGVAGCGVELPNGQTGELLRSEARLPEPFTVPLPAPAVQKPVRTEAGTEHYRVVQREAEVEILPGLRTKILSYDGTFPGPTFDVRSGRTTVVEHVNELPVPSVVHLHGGHTPAASDGWPLDLVLPPGGHAGHGDHGTGAVKQGRFAYTYPNTQRAATLWYHDHRMDFTGPQVYRGLFGLHLVRDDEEDALPLPAGEREVPLVIADRAFAADGSFRYPSRDLALGGETPGVEQQFMEGVLGDVVLVNGAPWPVLEVDAARYRFRILNASNARRYELALDPGTVKLVQIGSDGGLLGAPVEHESLFVAPAERFDVVVDFSAYDVGTEVTLVNRLGSGSTRQVMRFKVARRAVDDSSVPARLSSYSAVEVPAGVVRRRWRFSFGSTPHGRGWLINGKPFDPGRMEARPPLDSYEVWSFVTDVHHPIHVHLAPFQVLSRGGKEPGPYDAGWKDTVDIRPAEVVEVLVRFTQHKGKYLIHCHNLEHEDMAMMAAFETV